MNSSIHKTKPYTKQSGLKTIALVTVLNSKADWLLGIIIWKASGLIHNLTLWVLWATSHSDMLIIVINIHKLQNLTSQSLLVQLWIDEVGIKTLRGASASFLDMFYYGVVKNKI